MNTATLTGSLRDGVRDPKNTDRNLLKQSLIPKENARQLFDRMGARFGSLGLPPKQKPYTQPLELNLNQFGSGRVKRGGRDLVKMLRERSEREKRGKGKKKVSSNKMIRSQYAGRRRPRRRVGARKRMAGGFFGKIFSGIKSAVQKVAPIVQAIKPISRFGSMIGLPSPVVELGKQVGVGRRRRRRRVGRAKLAVVRRPTMVGMRRRRRVGMAKRRVGGARAGAKRLMRLF